MKCKSTHAIEQERQTLKSDWKIILGVFILALAVFSPPVSLFTFIFYKLISTFNRKYDFKILLIKYLGFLLFFILAIFIFNYRVQILGIGSLGWSVIILILIFSLYQPKNPALYGQIKKIFYIFIVAVIVALSYGRLMSSSRTVTTYSLQIRVESHYHNFSRSHGHANYFARRGIILYDFRRYDGELVWLDEPMLDFRETTNGLGVAVNYFSTLPATVFSPPQHFLFQDVRLRLCNMIILGVATPTLIFYILGMRAERLRKSITKTIL